MRSGADTRTANWVQFEIIEKQIVEGALGDIQDTVPGNTVCKPVTVMEDLTKKNEASREIYLLKPPYFRQFVDDFTKQALYKKGPASVKNNFLKRAGI